MTLEEFLEEEVRRDDLKRKEFDKDAARRKFFSENHEYRKSEKKRLLSIKKKEEHAFMKRLGVLAEEERMREEKEQQAEMRRAKIEEMYLLCIHGCTLKNIGKHFGLSYERVRQLLTQNYTRQELGWKERKPRVQKEIECICGKVFIGTETSGKFPKYCSKTCNGVGIRKSDEQKRQLRLKYQHERYHKLKDTGVFREHMRKWYLKKKRRELLDPEYREYQRRLQEKNHARWLERDIQRDVALQEAIKQLHD